jgi:uncharacterized repeat protein (TIGR03803 family)
MLCVPLLVALATAATAWPAVAGVNERVLYNFTGGADGETPSAPVLADTTGPRGTVRALYGTNYEGGAHAYGAIFKLTPPAEGAAVWTDSTLWGFSGGSGGGGALAGVFSHRRRISPETRLFGTTLGYPGGGNGTVFRLTGRSFETIWSFTGGSDGADPEGAVFSDATGTLYTTALTGGANGGGTVIKLTRYGVGQAAAWTETTLWAFTGKVDGKGPSSGLIADPGGALYGTASGGGAGGVGVVFKLTPPASGQTAWTEQTLYAFAGGEDGATPFAPLTPGPNGVLYGTTEMGGGGTGCFGQPCGTVFALTPAASGQGAWTEQVIWRFSGLDGGFPDTGLIIDANGVLYGTTLSGGAGQNGFAFKLTPPGAGQTAWTETTLWAFTGPDGSAPDAPLASDNAGVLYGTTLFGGPTNRGVVFSLTGTGFAQ